jgi:hypothetical protein
MLPHLRRFLAALILTAVSFAVTNADAQSVRMTTSISDSLRTAEPGTAVSLMFSIESPNGIGGAATVSAPPSWRVLTGGGPLPQGSRRMLYLVAVAVPSRAPAGKYQIDLTAGAGPHVSSARAWITVAEQRGISLVRLESPEMVVAGTEMRARFLLSNRGNVHTAVRLRVQTPQLRLTDTMTVQLDAGESIEIPVNVATQRGSTSVVQTTSSVTASIVGHPGIKAASSFRALIAPKEAYAPAPIHTIASHIRFIGASSQLAGSGMEIGGAGALRDGSRARIEYLARKMTGHGSVFGDRDVYRVAIDWSGLSVIAGDEVNRLSRLTESGRLARGVRVAARSNGWTLGGFATKETGLNRRSIERAVFLNRDFGNGVFFAANFLDRRQAGGGQMLSAMTSIRSLPIGTVEGEVGHAINSAPAEAWSISASGDFKNFSYSVNRQKTDRTYPGSTRGSETATGSFTAAPFNVIRMRASFNDYRIDQSDLVPRIGSSHHWNRIGAVIIGRTLTVEAIQTGRQERNFTADPRRDEKLGSARLSTRLGALSVAASAAFGSGSKRSGSGKREIARYTAQGSWRAGQKGTVSIGIESLRGGTLFVPDETSEIRASVGANLSTRLGSFSVNGYATRHKLVRTSNDASLDASWQATLARGQIVTLRARLHRNPFFESPDDNVMRAEYTIPFGMPAGASRTRGRVAGRVIDDQTRAPVSGVMVQLGRQVTVTDGKGRFAFSVDTANSVLLNLGGSAAMSGMVPLQDLPLQVYPRLGKTETLDIVVTAASRIEGQVRLFVAPPGVRIDDSRPPVESSANLGKVRIEATQDGTIRHTFTGSGGRFVFTDLRPGKWVLRVAAEDVPEQSVISGDSLIVDVRRGETAAARIDIVPRSRRIRMVRVR